jgi:hypothetical protein
MPDGNGTGRLDRIEQMLDILAQRLTATNDQFDRMRDQFDRIREEHDRDYKQLMTAQVLMQDNLRILVENQKHFDQRVDKLVSAIGEFIRSRPNPSPAA